MFVANYKSLIMLCTLYRFLLSPLMEGVFIMYVNCLGIAFNRPIGKDATASPIDFLNTLLQSIADRLTSQTMPMGKQCPVLFIDKASGLKTLLRDADCGHNVLESLFEWLILHTISKEKGELHVVISRYFIIGLKNSLAAEGMRLMF